jgi:hypothetical protein
MTRSALLLALLLTTCTTAAPAPNPQERPLVAEASIDPKPALGSIRIIRVIDWPDTSAATLLAVDTARGHAHVYLEARQPQRRLALDTIPLDGRSAGERWRASDEQAARLVNTYPRFRRWNESFSRDLTRYAAAIASGGPWSQRDWVAPLQVAVSPNGNHILYAVPPEDGRDGDWLMMAAPGDEAPRRFDLGLRASYRPAFSPDSQYVAWIGGAPEYARGDQLIGYVLHIAPADGGPLRAVPAVRDEIRTPMWSADSERVYAIGEQSAGQRCIYEIHRATLKHRALYCARGYLDLLLDPTQPRALVLEQRELPPEDGRSWDDVEADVHVLDLESAQISHTFQVLAPQGMGPFGVFLDAGRVAIFSKSGQRLAIRALPDGKLLHEIDLSAQQRFFTGRYATRRWRDELILLRVGQGALELVGVYVGQ